MKSVSRQRLLLRAGTRTCQVVNHARKQTSSPCSCSLRDQSGNKHRKKKKINNKKRELVGWKGNGKMGTKDVSPPTSPRRLRLSLEGSTSSASLELTQRWLQVSGEACRLRKSDSDSHTAAERSSIQQLLQEHEKSFFSWRREKWRKHPGVKKKKFIARKVFGGSGGNVAQNLSFWTVFHVLAPVKSCRRGFGKRWASPWGEDQHEGEEPQHFMARRLWLRGRKRNYFVSHSPPTH